MVQGLKPEQLEATDAWLKEQMGIAVRELKGETLTQQEQELTKKNPFYKKMLAKLEPVVTGSITKKAKDDSEKNTYDEAKITANVEAYETVLLGKMEQGVPPKGVMDAVSAKVSAKFDEAHWDEDDISGSIGSYMSAMSPGSIIGALMAGVKQALFSMGLDHFAAELKSLKSQAFAMIGKGEAMSTDQADNELRYQNAFAALSDEFEIDPKQSTNFGDAMAQVIKRNMKGYDERHPGPASTPAEPVLAQEPQKATQLDTVLAAIEGLTPEQKAAIKQMPVDKLNALAKLDGKEGISEKDVMEAFKQHIIPEASGKLVELKPEDLSKLAASMTAKLKESGAAQGVS